MDLLIRGGTLVTCDREDRVGAGDVLVRDGRIVALGPTAADQLLCQVARHLEDEDALRDVAASTPTSHFAWMLARLVNEGRSAEALTLLRQQSRNAYLQNRSHIAVPLSHRSLEVIAPLATAPMRVVSARVVPGFSLRPTSATPSLNGGRNVVGKKGTATARACS